MGIKEQKTRNKRKNRQTKRAWLIVCEGRNKTETNYLNHFNKWDGNVRLTIKPSEETDPAGMVKRAETLAKSLDINTKNGDRIICLMDLDVDNSKAALIEDLKRKHTKVEIIISNPCFEIWFLLHFTDHPTRENSSHNAKKQLERFIPHYTEGMDVLQKSKEIQLNYDIAIKNADNLQKEHLRNNIQISSADANPYTDMGGLMKAIINVNGAPQIY